MTAYCQDRDLLSIEPIIFLGAGFPSQQLTAGQNGLCIGTTFSASGADFTSTGVEAGMVLCSYATIPAEGIACEIVSVDSATSLTVSILRADTDASPVPPPGQSDVSFHVRTYGAQIRTVSDALAKKLQQIADLYPTANPSFADSAELRLAAAYGTLAEVFTARADNAETSDPNWIKRRHYQRLYQDIQPRLRVAADTDADGQTEQILHLGNLKLRRV